MPELDDELGEIGFMRRNAGVLQSLVQPNLLRGHGFDLDHLVGTRGLDEFSDNAIRFSRVACPMDYAATRCHLLLQLHEVVSQMRHRMRLELPAGFAELLPLRHLGDHCRPLGADGTGCRAQIPAELRVGERAAGRSWKGFLAPQIADSSRCRRRQGRDAQQNWFAHWTPLAEPTLGGRAVEVPESDVVRPPTGSS